MAKTTFRKKKLAKNVFGLLCEVLDENDIKYKKSKGAFALEFSVHGEDLSIPLDIVVDADLSDVLIMSALPFVIPKERREAIAVAVCEINSYVADGCFDFQYQTGEITFRISANFSNSIVSKDLLDYLVLRAIKTIDEFNDRFLFFSKSDMTPKQIVEFLR